MTPNDALTFIADPPLWRPEADEVHVSVAFTWDKDEGHRLQEAWSRHYEVVKIGGPAFGEAAAFVPGRYVRQGVTFTTRGCPRQCPWCLVPKREGKLRLLDIKPGWIVQDNNLLAAPRFHLREVFAMLQSQRRAVTFSGGLDARRLNQWVADELASLSIAQVFLAADTVTALRPLERAISRLAFLPKWKIRVYTLIGYDNEAMIDAEARMEAVWQMGGVPFAQLYLPADGWIDYPLEWKRLARTWSRPAAMAALHGGWT